ncbi:MAG: GntR family transcriptional regulator of vanillate catabolism [Parasphingorhabdus sp.]|jgi:GntR family transcriptional regulator of vanillate catabolism
MIFDQTTISALRLADNVYQQIMVAISEGELKPGDRLLQDKIAAQMNISRTPVREAILRLEQEGVLVKAERKGFSVRKVTAQEVRDVFGAREAVEGYATLIIATEKNPTQLAVINRAFDAENHNADDDLNMDFNLNRSLHRSIVEQTGNQLLLKIFDSIWNSPAALRIFAATHTESIKPLLSDHQILLDSILHESPEFAQAAAIEHIRDGLDIHIESVKYS